MNARGKVVTRFAPSPTGHLHIGGARTAVFCMLLARHYGGRFLLRIEDTDLERSRQEYTDSILASMRRLKLDWDGDPIFQKDRFDIYNSGIDRLLASGHAYWCGCSPEEVEAMREKARSEGKKPRYDGRCRTLGLGPGPGRSVRLAAPREGRIEFDDMVKGHLSFDASELDDMILRRSDGSPTYNFSVVVDDAAMNVTHVLRGDDHVNNTPRQILIYRALGAELPVFGHVPMILGPDRQKLSKRHGAKAVIEYDKDGLLPDALVNYLVRLGWSCGDREIFDRDELVRLFDGNNLNRSPAAFDPQKLLWVNAEHLRRAAPETLLPELLPFLREYGLEKADEKLVLACIRILQARVRTLTDMAGQMRPLLTPAAGLTYESGALESLTPEARRHLAELRGRLAGAKDFDRDALHAVIQAHVEEKDVKFKAVGQPLRVALLGSVNGPDIAQVMQAVGRDDALAKLDRALELTTPMRQPQHQARLP
ncbi:MAG: glutamate--tRNA ligase [Desulfovibrio sp.]|jgi:glutamyl-tRNA synthetase|nr:glutamate--tRNA ligase [Desulfovibrio sp.]